MRERNIDKLIAEYKAKFSTNPGAELWLSDLKTLWRLSLTDAKESGSDPLYFGICNGFDVGFMVGYRKALRDQAKR